MKDKVIVTDIPLDDSIFNKFKRYIYKLTGIHLADTKKEFLKARLGERLRQLELSGFKEYYDLITSRDGVDELSHFLNAISTNLTYFYREPAHFDFLYNKILPEFEKRPAIIVWSAGCSEGAEPYTIAICIHEYFERRGIAPEYRPVIKIYATDISTDVLKKAIRGIYSKGMLNQIPTHLRHKYFHKGVHSMKGSYKIKDVIKKYVRFSAFNLLDPFTFNIKFDIIFCRNVMIYFDSETRKQLGDRFFEKLYDGGYFFIGHSESVASLNDKFVAPSIYRK